MAGEAERLLRSSFEEVVGRWFAAWWCAWLVGEEERRSTGGGREERKVVGRLFGARLSG